MSPQRHGRRALTGLPIGRMEQDRPAEPHARRECAHAGCNTILSRYAQLHETMCAPCQERQRAEDMQNVPDTFNQRSLACKDCGRGTRRPRKGGLCAECIRWHAAQRYKCPDCGGKKDRHATRCLACGALAKRGQRRVCPSCGGAKDKHAEKCQSCRTAVGREKRIPGGLWGTLCACGSDKNRGAQTCRVCRDGERAAA